MRDRESTHSWNYPFTEVLCRPVVYEDSSWVSGEVRTYHDYSRIRRSHPVIYMLPHLWTGVIPRMMDGYKCVVADQMVSDHLDAWHSLLRSGASTD